MPTPLPQGSGGLLIQKERILHDDHKPPTRDGNHGKPAGRARHRLRHRPARRPPVPPGMAERHRRGQRVPLLRPSRRPSHHGGDHAPLLRAGPARGPAGQPAPAQLAPPRQPGPGEGQAGADRREAGGAADAVPGLRPQPAHQRGHLPFRQPGLRRRQKGRAAAKAKSRGWG